MSAAEGGCLTVGAAGLLLAAWGGATWLGARRRDDDGVDEVRGTTVALATMLGAVRRRECVYIHEIVEDGGSTSAFASSNLMRDDDDPLDADESSQSAHETISDGERGVFLVNDGSRTVLVWPTGIPIGYCGGWDRRESPDGGRLVRERTIEAGARVLLRGRAGRFSDMMAAMSGSASDLPTELLRVLQTREDLRALPCFWSGNLEGLWEEGAEPEPPGELGLTALIAGLACAAVSFGALLFLRR